jgi:2-keto-4-pentenoate hydratase/2-oxohepta-3-ene-1,7-dioic acid hydratase in catechol pathway
MRFTRYRGADGAEGLAVAENGHWLGLPAGSDGFPGTLDTLVRRGDQALSDAAEMLRARGQEIDTANVTFLPLLSKSNKIICVGLNYRDHSAESGFTPPEHPTIFARFTSSLIGHQAPIVRPPESHSLDFEGELAVVIGKSGRRIPAAQALSHVAGYAVFNDGSIRDYQLRTPQWTVGKNFDGTGAFGPELVTPEELPPGCRGLRLETRVNGTVVQSASTDELIFDVATLITELSEAFTLEAGDVIVTGTPAGVGFARKPPLFLKPGDVCEVSISQLGTLRNPIVDEVV